ncbi:sodium-dependent phosphate transport protein 1-like [Puma concolor]|uniref:Sodium-dependent phosphate transport protein 1-like n=1 Tax=Puma concolor TaxID=9696 RepID=A0A6P6HAU3_PUMCO|nr:sodium-dependent phosphate transport protein 1-like [Puma concolor]
MNLMVDFQDVSSPLEDSNSHTPPLKTRGKVKVKEISGAKIGKSRNSVLFKGSKSSKGRRNCFSVLNQWRPDPAARKEETRIPFVQMDNQFSPGKGACGCGVSLLWFLLFYDDPKTHPCISVSEKNYILSSLNQQQSSSRTRSLPIKAMIKSLPLWAIVFGSFAFHWTNNIVLFYTPTFVDSNLHVNVKENGLLSAFPYLFAWSFGILAGHAADFFLSRNILRLNSIRKLFSTLGLFLPPFFGLCLVHLSFTFYSTIVFLILTGSTGSFCMAGLLINVLDIAPSYYGFLKGVTNVIGMIGGLISSILCGMILNENPESGWFKIFFLTAGVNVTGLLFCLIFGKAEIQDWDTDRPEQTRL